jgi:hypothetical protein
MERLPTNGGGRQVREAAMAVATTTATFAVVAAANLVTMSLVFYGR